MAYKMIFSDMDGTLLKSETEISQKNVDKVIQAVRMGTEFVICTGRGVYGVERFLDQLKLMGRDGYVICQNGAAVYDLRDMRLAIQHNFTADVLRPVVETARKLGVAVYLYDDRTFMAEKMTEEVEAYCRVMHTDMRILPDGLEYEGRYTKCLLSGPTEKLERLKLEVAPAIDGQLNMFFSSPTYLEFVKKGVNKGKAMEETAAKAHVDLKEVIAIGDSENDLSMIQKAGLGIAVANAQDHVKAAADFVTQGTCREDAVAEVIDRFILGK